MFKKLFTIAIVLSPVCSYCAFDSLNEMRRDNERQMDRMMDRLNEERYLSETRRANYEQERINRTIIKDHSRKLFGR
jgi:hypothetical protein